MPQTDAVKIINAAALVAQRLSAQADDIERTSRFPAPVTDALISTKRVAYARAPRQEQCLQAVMNIC